MKSRWTTYLLLVVVVGVWGVVAWRIFAPESQSVIAPEKVKKYATAKPAIVDTLRLNYPDPFLKGSIARTSTLRSSVRQLPPVEPKVKREKVKIVHIGTLRSTGQMFHILTIGNEQFELQRSESAGEFTLMGDDADSIYLKKDGLIYGVKRCE